jgi:hypothetical protein
MTVYQIGYMIDRKISLVQPPGPVIGDIQKMLEFSGISGVSPDLVAAVKTQKVYGMVSGKLLRDGIEAFGTAEPGFAKKKKR